MKHETVYVCPHVTTWFFNAGHMSVEVVLTLRSDPWESQGQHIVTLSSSVPDLEGDDVSAKKIRERVATLLEKCEPQLRLLRRMGIKIKDGDYVSETRVCSNDHASDLRGIVENFLENQKGFY